MVIMKVNDTLGVSARLMLWNTERLRKWYFFFFCVPIHEMRWPQPQMCGCLVLNTVHQE